MARTITRQTLNLFGSSGASTNFAEFGSQAASAPVKTKSIATIQALAAYAAGWQNAVALGNAPYLEDMNALEYLKSYQLCYLFQEGVSEYDAGTTYFIGSVVKVLNTGFVEFYSSLTDANVGNAPGTRVTNASWQFLHANSSSGLIIPGLVGVTDASSPAAGQIGEVKSSTNSSGTNLGGSGVYTDIANIALMPGTWMVGGQGYFFNNAATVTAFQTLILPTSGNTASGSTTAKDLLQIAPPPITNSAITILPFRVSTAGSPTYYLKGYGTYSAATPVGYGTITAIRIF